MESKIQKSLIRILLKHIAYSYGCKLVCADDDKFSKAIKTYLGKDAV